MADAPAPKVSMAVALTLSLLCFAVAMMNSWIGAKVVYTLLGIFWFAATMRTNRE